MGPTDMSLDVINSNNLKKLESKYVDNAAMLEDEIVELENDISRWKESYDNLAKFTGERFNRSNKEIQQLKAKIDFYEAELHRRGYVVKPKDSDEI